jgi:DNA invertase Pin-like site-specific DNA recombinase
MPMLVEASLGLSSAKITDQHRARGAIVYVRQSTYKQVQHNRESQHNQYALVQRALELGWVPERVRVFDADQGHSGQDGQRADFRDLVAEVSLGRVGLVLTYEASRLARSNADWYALLDLAAIVGALIADADGVYDPRTYNDRLLLGLRGMLSEAELHLLQLRLAAGRLRQVERGAYQQHLPTGLVRLPDGRVVKDPDQQVQAMIALVFQRFATLGSCQKVLRSLRDDGLLLPRHQVAGLYAGQLLWKKPSDAAVYDQLRNPAYAGAFVYGRLCPHPDRRPGQSTRRMRRPTEEWPVVHRDAYPAYLSWDQFLANQVRMSDNASCFERRARGAARQGDAILAGLVVCGRCGRQMRVAYKPQIRYFCAALSQTYGEPMCLHLDGASIERVVVDAFFAALAPAELDLLDEVLAERRADRERVARQHADRVARAAYEVRLARRQYDAVDPDNRLVATELERRWELALRAEVEAREAAVRFAGEPAEPGLGPTLRAQLSDLGRQLPDLWTSGRLSAVHKKELLRALIRRIILARPRPDTIEVKVVWVSGAFSVLKAHPPIHRAVDVTNYRQVVERVLTLAAEGYQDREIARRLTTEGFRSARDPTRVPTRLVAQVRRAHGQASLTEQFRCMDKLEGQWTVWGLARALGVDRNWFYRRIYKGTLPATRHLASGHYLIPDDPALLTALRAEVAMGRRRSRPLETRP